jgi:hypothetical protein
MGKNEGSMSFLLSKMPQNNKEKIMLGNMPSNYTKYLKQVLMYRRWVQIYLGAEGLKKMHEYLSQPTTQIWHRPNNKITHPKVRFVIK